MKTTEFNKIYKQAKNVNIITNEWFNFAGFFWLNLTDNQHNKMVELILNQPNLVIVEKGGYKWIRLKDGLLLKINEEGVV